MVLKASDWPDHQGQAVVDVKGFAVRFALTTGEVHGNRLAFPLLSGLRPAYRHSL